MQGVPIKEYNVTTMDLFSAMRLQDNALCSDAISILLHLSLSSIRFPSIIRIINFMLAVIFHEKSIQCFRKSNISLTSYQNFTHSNVNPMQSEATEFLPLIGRMFLCKTSFISRFPKQNNNKNKFTGQAAHSRGGVSTTARNEGPVPWHGMC